jgi:hypothetical protein
MNLITVECRRAGEDQDVEPRLGVVIAADGPQAVELCKNAYAHEGFTDFEVYTVIEGSFDGPARLLGHTGQKGAFSWKK